MMSISEVCPEQFAQLFHHYHEALEPEYSSNFQRKSDCQWQELSALQRERLVAAARLTLLELAAFTPKQSNTEGDTLRRWFAKPGEAEWGC